MAKGMHGANALSVDMFGQAVGRIRRSKPLTATERAAQLAHFEARIAARNAADPAFPYKELFRLANPANVGAEHRIVNGRFVGLVEHHENLRRCFALRAWCAVRIAHIEGIRRTLRVGGWHYEARSALTAARMHGRIARIERAREVSS